MEHTNRHLIRYLKSVLFLVLVIVVIGGITRLTDSGLSMVEWQPVMGILPPLTHTAWEQLFLQYQTYPDFYLKQSDIDLAGFKIIFFWEYLHRVLGRIVGLVALIPFIVLWIKGQREWMFRLGMIPVLIGIQGFIGWWMVKSGLVDRPSVSHIRLAIHLLMAFFIAGYTYWHILRIRYESYALSFSPVARLSRFLMMGLILQVLYGVLLAGLDGGYVFPTWPKMGDAWIADAVFLVEGFRNFFYNPFMLQFIHRWIPGILLILIGVLVFKSWTASTHIRIAARQFTAVFILQIVAGISTLLTGVFIPIAILHQFIGLILLLLGVKLIYFSHYDELKG